MSTSLPEARSAPRRVARRHCSLPVAAGQPGTTSQRRVPEQIPAWDSRAVSYISVCRTVSNWTHVLELRAPLQGCIIILLPRLLVFFQDWLLSSCVALCRRKTCSISTVPGCISPVIHAVVPVSYKDSVEHQEKKRDLCAAFFLWRWANMRARISKLSQPKDGIFNFHEYVVLAVLQKGTFQNSRVWGKYIWSLTSWTAFSVIAQTTSLWLSASKFSLHSPSLVFQSYIYKAITWQHLHESRFLLGIYKAS